MTTPLVLLSLTSCWVISYDVQPGSAWDLERYGQPRFDTLYYKVLDVEGITFADEGGVVESLAGSGLFRDLKRAREAPDTGIYVEVIARRKSPSALSLVWGYVALSLGFFILPAYSGSSGFFMEYELFVDGEARGFYSYEIDRSFFAWLPLLPFFWVNGLTSWETDAFEATTLQFLADAVADGALEPRGDAISLR